MTQYYIVVVLVRLVLPVALIFSIALRPFGMSIAYLLLFLLSPCIQVPDRRTLSTMRVKFLLLTVVISVALLLVHAVWHCVLAGYVPYGALLTDHPLVAEIGQNFGLVSFKKIHVLKAMHYLAPELIMTSVSLVVYVGVIKLLAALAERPSASESKHQTYPLLVSSGKYVCLLLLMLSSSLRPSITSGIYFIMFMSLATAWSIGRTLDRGFAVVGRCIMAIMGLHIIVLLLYQTTWFTQHFPSTHIFARLFGLTQIVIHGQNDFTYAVDSKHKWATDLSPLVILFTYHIFAVETRELFKPKPKKKAPLTGLEKGKSNGSLVRGVSFHRTTRRTNRDKWLIATERSIQASNFKSQVAIRYIDSKRLRQKQDASESTPLIKTRASPGKSPTALGWSNKSLRNILQDSTGSIVLGDDGESGKDSEPTLLDDIIDAVVDFFQVLIRSSYIATTITMMAWSIMYHSWLTFVFLMWANIVWLCQDQRSFMLKTSPVLVLYAMVLLVCQYIYGMDLTESELPTNVTQVNIHQIGLGRTPGVPPCVPVIIKSLFTCMFWVTLRQRIQELRQKRQASIISDVAGPLHLSVSTAASVMEQQREDESKSRLLRILGEFLRAACARYWIYVVAIMLFVIGITGERMTIFRIIYMFLFLSFILIFQISWYWWRRLMYAFWIVVIVYSMVNLILIYIYQFDNFSKKIAEYLYINEKLQHDLGLEPYHPADLFLKLLTPTLFLIITIMQVHYFHKDFMELSAPKSRLTSKDTGSALSREPGSSRLSQAGASTIKDDITQLPLESEPRIDEDMATETSISTLNQSKNKKQSSKRSHSRSRKSVKFRTWVVNGFNEGRRKAAELIDGMFMYLDLHLVKIIMIALMLLCVFNVQAMHVPIMLLVCPALLVSAHMQRYCVLAISTMISVYFMAKMVYQIDYISHSYFDVNCSSIENDSYTQDATFNNAEWVGFKKTTHSKPLVVQLKGYIGLIAMFTFYSLVLYRQKNLRKTKKTPRELLMFPKIRREHADKDLLHCLKYLCNYGFYKFGVEICLICMVGVIGSRMDVYSVLNGFWLLVFVSVSRATQARLWMPYTLFLSVSISLQYLLAVGFLPQFCVQYPWSGSSEQIKHIRTWLFLPYNAQPPKAVKLIFDFFLLMFSTLQLRVFNIEKTEGESYGGGSNSEDIGHNWETLDFVNPVPDFLGFVGTWLDVIKRIVFLGMLWVTLAIMFMTGANRVNLFSMGYLIGSFIFLWQGTDFYLLPKESILEWWSWLLRYNVTVVLIKTLLQIPGCIFKDLVQENACWIVQLLGIGCVDKFAGGSIAKYFKMQYNKSQVCGVPQEDIGLAWDGVCFAFLILQRRLFYSYYFYRVIDESKATTVLASRGAELIEELRLKQMRIQEEQETRILEKIKVKMERIKANQKRIQGVAKDTGHHDTEDEDEDDTQQGVGTERAALERGDSEGGGGGGARGYHTPDSPATPRGFHTPISEPSAPPSPEHSEPVSPARSQPASPARSTLASPPAPPALPPSSSHGGPPSPSSALLTSLSLDAYLEPRRISFESPPSSELAGRAQSPEESYPVFSPPPIRRRHTVHSPSLLQRTSIISQSSRSEPKSHHTWPDSPENEAPNRPVYKTRSKARQCPPYKSPTSHQKAIRSGDYYMFEDFDDTDVRELMHEDKADSDDEAPKEMGLSKLLSTAIKTDLKHALMMRRASMPAVRAPRHCGVQVRATSSEAHRRGSQFSSRSAPEIRRDADADDHTVAQTTQPDNVSVGSSNAPEEETWFDKMQNIIETTSAVIGSSLVSMTRQLMRYSRDYRYVSRTLTIEKKVLKEKEGFGIGLRQGSQMRWEPLPETIVTHRKLSEISVPEIRILAPSMERGLDDSPPRSPSPDTPDDDDTSEHESAFTLQSTESKDVAILGSQDDSMFKHDRSPIVHLLYALWYAVLAHTDIVCYIMVFINQIQSATILSIPLPLMVFLWGTLTIPRPTKIFWVTLIAYTEVIVLIKSMFQFEILPWNQKEIPANMPFTAPRIIGIERKSNYALYDLLLLLIIFFHRFMLKSLGLWKESTPEGELREDMNFELKPEDTQMLVEGRGAEVGKKYVKLNDETGPLHRLVDRLHHVQATITEAMHELKTTRSDPRVATLVHRRLLVEREERRRQSLMNRQTRRSIREGEVNHESSLDVSPTPESSMLVAGPSVPQQQSEDDHYKVNDEQEPIIAVITTMEDTYSHYPDVIWLSIKQYLRPMYQFFKRMLEPEARVTADIYAYMFLCDFFNFLIVIFGFAAFGTHQGDGGVQAYLEENKVPIPFLVMLILQFVLIVADRALYLRKFMLGKILFQYALIIGVHIWMFFILPFITERTFNSLPPPPMWYMVKCIYLLLSAYQIRCGYPRRIIGNFLCKSYRFINMCLFRGFMAVPFVFELRTLMDWIWTDTSMSLMDWLKMEDIFANVYLLKCSRHMEDEFPQERGLKKSNISKYMLGGGVLAVVIAIIWFPLVFFAFGNTVGESNPPTDVTVKLRIGPFLPVYQMSAQSHNIEVFSEQDYAQLSNMYARDRTAQTFLSNYMYNDLAVVSLNPNSTMKWEISPPELDRLEQEVISNSSLKVKFTFVITHPSNNAQNPPMIEDSREVEIPAFTSAGRNPERQVLYNMLQNKSEPSDWLNVPLLFPKFLKVFNKGTAKPAYQLMPILDDDRIDDTRLYRNVQLRLERDKDSMYWRVREMCTKRDPLLALPQNNCDMLVLYTFNDKLFPEKLNFISGGGIIGLYTTFVFLASRVIRGYFSGIFTKIMFDDLPYVDRVLQLCLDIYLVREALEFALEEDLFAKLVFLYRSPETMIKWSRPKEEPPPALPPSP